MSLAEKLRPWSFEEFIGQKHLLGEHAPFKTLILKKKKLFSFILWGPPGTGKTTLAYLVGKYFKANFIPLSAVDTSVKELKQIIENARKLKKFHTPTIVFIDEIQRFNKSQQTFLLPFVEKEDIYLIGATTENPSFEIIPPLLSRTRVFLLKPLSKTEILKILKRAVADSEKGLGNLEITVEDDVLNLIAEVSEGDARTALNTLELLVEHALADGKKILKKDDVSESFLFKPLLYDRAGEEHYNLISAFHKSMRGSDPDAAVYWLVRMLSAGEDPLYIARRIIICAAEDVGLADPMALTVAVSAKQALEFLGQPEGEIPLAMAAIYVASAPKSNSAYKALKLAYQEVKKTGSLPVPLHLRNPVTKLMEKLGYGKNYKYAHDYPEGFVFQQYLPDKIKNQKFFFPTERGKEKEIKERLQKLWKKIKNYSSEEPSE